MDGTQPREGNMDKVYIKRISGRFEVFAYADGRTIRLDSYATYEPLASRWQALGYRVVDMRGY